MDCQIYSEVTLGDWGQELLALLDGARSPLSGTFELTERCNLACVHCFINRPAAGREAAARELTPSQISTILDAAVAAGCILLLLTGGEVLLRPDFPDIYRSALGKGLLVSLFTNGTLLSPRLADLLAEWRPCSIEISLYGATQQVYERVTQVPGSYARCRQGIDLLLERGLPLTLKAAVLSTNRHDLLAMKALAGELGLPFRYDALLWPRLDGGQGPLAYRLPVHDIAALDRDDPERLRQWRLLYGRPGASTVRSESVYGCGAGLHAFHVDCSGRLSMCMMARRPAYDLLQGSFDEGWEQFLGALVGRKRVLNTPCTTCDAGVLCTQCPGWSQAVHGDDETPVDLVCQLGRLRAAHIYDRGCG
jgi:radical SAM protein with 4Fe4S-binding SPASM domain